jgi:hypothetical protein
MVDMTGRPQPQQREIEKCVPDTNQVRHGVGTDAQHKAAVWSVERKRWEIYERIDAREIVASGAGAWVDDDGNPPPQS